MKYRVRHSRKLECIVVVEAESADDACLIVEEGEVGLDDCDVLDEEIEVDDAIEQRDGKGRQ